MRNIKIKHVIIYLLVISIGMTLAGCKSSAVKSVEEMISQIGAVSQSSENLIVQAEEAFQALSVKDRDRVSNYNTLLQARQIFNSIPRELTLDNYRNYFNVSCSYGDSYLSSSMVFEYYITETLLEIYQVAGGTLGNVTMKLKITVPEEWEINYRDDLCDSYNKDTREVEVLVQIPSSGYYSQTILLEGPLFSNISTPKEDCIIEVVSISGTVMNQ